VPHQWSELGGLVDLLGGGAMEWLSRWIS
jgi:hypothetical protein